VGLFINQPRGTGLSCKLNRTIEYVQRSTELRQAQLPRSRRSLSLFDHFRATENSDLPNG
jgi:hypothetical protein